MYVDHNGSLLRGNEAHAARTRRGVSRTGLERTRVFALTLVSVLGLMAALNPNEESLRAHLDQSQSLSLAGSVYHTAITMPLRVLGMQEEKFVCANPFWSWGTARDRNYLGVLGIWIDITAAKGILSPLKKSSTLMGPADDISVIILINVVIWLAWCLLPSMFMTNHFTVSQSNVRAGRVHTLLSAALSHEELSHLLLNIFSFAANAPHAQLLLGTQRFRVLLVTGALVGNMGSLLYHAGSYREALGGSGSLYAILGFAACHATWSSSLTPLHVVWFGLILTLPQALFANIALSMLVQNQGTDTAMHLSGAVAGGLFYYCLSVGLA